MNSKRILIVDDDEDIRSTFMDALALEGYQVVDSKNGKEALEAMSQPKQKPDLVLLDMMMPIMNGAQFLDCIRTTEFSETPVVVFSAHADPQTIPGAKAFLRKPVDLSTLLDVIEKFCHSET